MSSPLNSSEWSEAPSEDRHHDYPVHCCGSHPNPCPSCCDHCTNAGDGDCFKGDGPSLGTAFLTEALRSQRGKVHILEKQQK